MRWALAVVALAVGCYHPTAATDVPCSDNLACPSGQSCDTTQSPPICIAGDAGVPIDDAMPGDGPVLACSDAMPCPASEPICDGQTHTCRGCHADTECSGACDEHIGTCIADADVLYVDPMGDDSKDCTDKLAPCATVTRALAVVTATRNFIAVGAGSYVDSFTVSQPVTISGPAFSQTGATLSFTSHGGTTGRVVDVTVAGAVLIEGLTLDGMNMSGDAVRVENGQVTLTLFHVHVQNASGNGVFSRGTTTITKCEIDGSANSGVQSNAGTTNVVRSTIHDNGGSGIRVQGAARIENAVVFGNGSTGIEFDGGAMGGGMQSVAFSTIVGNGAPISAQQGVDCKAGSVGVDSSILVGNGATPQVSGNCTTSYSLFDDATPADATSLTNTDPLFVDETNNDFHLTAGSPAIDSANPMSTVHIDLDGDSRPRGAGFDMGADEH